MEKDAGVQPTPGKFSHKKSRTESLDRSQQKKTPGMSLAHKGRNLNIVKDKYNLIFYPSYILESYMYTKKREKLKIFCFINGKLVNELCYMLQSSDLDIFSSKRKKKEKKEKDC